MPDEQKRPTLISLIYREKKLWVSILTAVILMVTLVVLVYFLNAPNPNMILIAGLVVCSSLFGYPGGVVAGIIMFVYTLFYFSTDNTFVTFTDQNMEKVIISLAGIVVDMVFICELKRESAMAFRKIDQLTETLKEDNRLLQELSLTDALTKCRNRLSLRHDFPNYINHPVAVMMMDVDDFKSINDLYGHDQGDKALEMTGKLLSDAFGREHSYRYGGDEFLVICPEVNEQQFKVKIEMLMENRPEFTADGQTVQVNYSIGYAFGNPGDEPTLRHIMLLADERLYAAKRNGKNIAVGK